jgi:hypothetical protein
MGMMVLLGPNSDGSGTFARPVRLARGTDGWTYKPSHDQSHRLRTEEASFFFHDPRYFGIGRCGDPLHQVTPWALNGASFRLR